MKGPGPSRGNWLRRLRVLLDRRTGQLLRTPKGWRVYGRPIGISLVLALAIALVVAQNFLPNRITLRAGDVATQNIVAPRSVRYESLTKTQEARDAAASQVPDQFDAALTTQQRQAIDSLGSKLTDLRKQGSGPAQAAQLSLLEPQLTDAQREYLLQTDDATVAATIKNSGDLVQELMGNGIKAETLSVAQATGAARASSFHLDRTATSVIASLVRDYLRVNFQPQVTALKREQARDAIPPVFVTIARGETIVRYGDLVTPFQVEEAQQVGLLAPRTDWSLILAMLLLAKIMVPIDPRAQYAVPMAAVAMLVAALLDTGLGIIVALGVGLLTGIIADNLVELTLVGFFGGAIGAISVNRLERLGQWVSAALLVAGAQFVTLASLGLIERRQSIDEITGMALIAAAGGLVSALVAAGSVTYLGEVMRVITPMKLLELMTPNNP